MNPLSRSRSSRTLLREHHVGRTLAGRQELRVLDPAVELDDHRDRPGRRGRPVPETAPVAPGQRAAVPATRARRGEWPVAAATHPGSRTCRRRTPAPGGHRQCHTWARSPRVLRQDRQGITSPRWSAASAAASAVRSSAIHGRGRSGCGRQMSPGAHRTAVISPTVNGPAWTTRVAARRAPLLPLRVRCTHPRSAVTIGSPESQPPDAWLIVRSGERSDDRGDVGHGALRSAEFGRVGAQVTPRPDALQRPASSP